VLFALCSFEQFGEQTLLLIFCGPKGNGKTLRTERAMAAFVKGWITMSGPSSAKAGMQGTRSHTRTGSLPLKHIGIRSINSCGNGYALKKRCVAVQTLDRVALPNTWSWRSSSMPREMYVALPT
jgi:hypothetical protein